MPPHTIAPGETLFGLASANGLKDYKVILDHPDNAAFKKKWADPGILPPGEKIFIPNREMKHSPGAVDAKHTFNVSPPTAWLRIALRDAEGVALAGKKYELAVEGKTFTGNIASGGIIEQKVGVAAKNGTLKVWTSASDAVEWTLKIGYMDPIDTISGLQARLNNLGFPCGEPDGVMNEQTTDAVKAFQERIGAEPTGVADDLLRKKLLSYYDPAAAEKDQDAKPK